MTTDVATRKGKGEVRRGRRPRLSRDAVLTVAAEMIARQPAAPFSLNALARELGASPMALYTYFGSSHDLHQALTEHMLRELVVEMDAAMPPLDAIAGWCHATRAFFLRYPQLIHLLIWEGGGASIAWFNKSLPLVDALRRTGLDGEDLARATLWVWGDIMGAIHNEISNRAAPQVITPDQVARMEPALHAPVTALLAMVGGDGHFDSFFDYQVARLLDAIAALTNHQRT
ncbi:TetR/AcrR family transcriptional regulator [Sphingomonas sp. DBB INV C78]|uniref:TetR/AcrR family transcriptional regulator n=1 Tax=Sphingomonas sp. DBB INV C78 TaxID=3349434 RepID=UPI0036D42497